MVSFRNPLELLGSFDVPPGGSNGAGVRAGERGVSVSRGQVAQRPERDIMKGDMASWFFVGMLQGLQQVAPSPEKRGGQR